MRKILILAALLLLPFSISLKAGEHAPLKGVLMGTMTVNDNFDADTWSGGFKIGTLVSIDSEKGMFLRTMFTRSSYGPSEDDIESISISVLSEWYLGKKFGFYATFGGDTYVSGDFSGTDPFLGFGLTKPVWTDSDASFKIPAQIDLFFELNFQDGAGQPTGGYNQVNFGLIFSKPVK